MPRKTKNVIILYFYVKLLLKSKLFHPCENEQQKKAETTI